MLTEGERERLKSVSLAPVGGKGYSKRGETSNGVPRMEDGECRLKSARLRRGFRDLEWAATLSARESACLDPQNQPALPDGRITPHSPMILRQRRLLLRPGQGCLHRGPGLA